METHLDIQMDRSINCQTDIHSNEQIDRQADSETEPQRIGKHMERAIF